MARKIMALLLGVLLLCSFTGCGGSDDQEVIRPDVNTLAEKLMTGIQFEDSVEEISLSTALKYYGIDAGMVQEGKVYVSTGATSEEMVVLEAVSGSSAVHILNKLTQRRDDRVKMYLKDELGEVARLDEAVLYSRDCFVVFAVSDASQDANDIIKEYLE